MQAGSSAFDELGASQALDQCEQGVMFFEIFRRRLIGPHLRFQIVEARHAVVIKSFDTALARILNEDERLGDITKIVTTLILVLQMEPVQVAAGITTAGFNATLSPQPQADV
jgi:hypothetical protein